MEITTYYAKKDIKLEQVEQLLKEKLGDKYTYKVKKKAGSYAGKFLNSTSHDKVTVIKNAFHRYDVLADTSRDPRSTDENATVTIIDVLESHEIAGWLKMLHKEGGFIGRMIIRQIYGSGNEYYREIKDVVFNNIEVTKETSNIPSVGDAIGSLFGKKK